MLTSWYACCCFFVSPRPLTVFTSQERRKLIKEAQREKRKNKVPKHVKKRKEKVAKMKKGRWKDDSERECIILVHKTSHSFPRCGYWHHMRKYVQNKLVKIFRRKLCCTVSTTLGVKTFIKIYIKKRNSRFSGIFVQPFYFLQVGTDIPWFGTLYSFWHE